MKFSTGDGAHNTPAMVSGHFCDTNGLESWENALEQRKRIHEKLCKKLNRAPGELLMNTADELRHVKEDKLVLEYTKIPQHFDKYRGNPVFWKLPNALFEEPDVCHPNPDPRYFVTPSKEEKNEIPQIEYITVPDYVMGEKDILPRNRNMHEAWKSSRYKKLRSEKLDSKIKFIEPHKPRLEEVIVLGKRFSHSQPPSQPSTPTSSKHLIHTCCPKQTLIDENDQQDSEEVPRIRFIINGVTFSDRMHFSTLPVITLEFTYDVTSDKILTQNLVLENTGRVAIHLSWNRYEKFDLFSSIKTRPYEIPTFFFDINDMTLIPNQKVELPIMIRSPSQISFSEIWKITSRPRIDYDRFYIMLKLTYHGFIRGLNAKSVNIHRKLETNAKNNVIKSVIRDILAGLKYTEKPVISLKYSEKELFESINYNHGPFTSEPQYVYDKAIVSELKDFYQYIKKQSHPEEWNLCIKDLKRTAREKDLAIYLEKKSEETSKINNKNLELEKLRQDLAAKKALAKAQGEDKKQKGKGAKSTKSKDKSSGSKKSKSKDSSTETEKKSKSGKPKSKVGKSESFSKKRLAKSRSDISQRNYHQQLMAILKKLKKPDMTKNSDRLKYFHVYSILSTYISLMFESADTLRWNMLHSKFVNQILPNYRRQERPERLIYEYFDDTLTFDKSEKIPLQSFLKAKPKADSVKEISEENIDALHEAYFGESTVTSATGKGGKGGKGKKEKKVKNEKKEKKDKKEKKSDASNKRGKSAKKSQTNIQDGIPDFDPFSEELVTNDDTFNVQPVTSPLETESLLAMSEITKKMWEENLYLTFYSYISEAIDVITETCDQFLDESASALLVREAKKHTWNDNQLTPGELSSLIDKKIAYPPEEKSPEEDENVRTYLIEEIVRPMKSEVRAQASFWSLIQAYKPIPDTPPEVIPTPDPIIVKEPRTKDMEIQVSHDVPEDIDLVERYMYSHDVNKEASLVSNEDSTTEFHYYYIKSDDNKDLEMEANVAQIGNVCANDGTSRQNVVLSVNCGRMYTRRCEDYGSYCGAGKENTTVRRVRI